MADKKPEKQEEAVASNDARFSTVKEIPAKDLAPSAGRHVQEERGKPNESKEAI